MADLHYLFNSINGGEMSPQMDLRVDNEKYNSGARVLENFIVKPYGGIYKRPGTQYVRQTLGNATARIEGFTRNQDSAYILEFTEQKLRIHVVYNNTETETGRWTEYRADGSFSSFQDLGLFTNNGSSLSGWVPGDYYNTAFNPTGTYYQNQLFTANVTITATNGTDQPLSAANWTDYWTPYYYKPNDIIRFVDTSGDYL